MNKASLPKNKYWPGSTADLVFQECEPRFLRFFDRFLQEHIDGCKERRVGYFDLVALQINFRERFLKTLPLRDIVYFEEGGIQVGKTLRCLREVDNYISKNKGKDLVLYVNDKSMYRRLKKLYGSRVKVKLAMVDGDGNV